MATFDVFNLKRERVGSIELADEVFGVEVREHLFYEVVKAQLASKRQGTQAAKNRSAVSGSTKKLYKQKGTGRARHGSLRAPVFVGGGRAHPPRPRDWSYAPPRRMRARALIGALSKFGKEGRLLVVDRFELAEIKTKKLLETLETLNAQKNALVVDLGQNDKLRLSIRNCKAHQFLAPEGVNVYDLLRHDTLILSQEAARALEQRCLKQAASRSEHDEVVPVVAAAAPSKNVRKAAQQGGAS
jgi:large subunit ribosomal protein L4